MTPVYTSVRFGAPEQRGFLFWRTSGGLGLDPWGNTQMTSLSCAAWAAACSVGPSRHRLLSDPVLLAAAAAAAASSSLTLLSTPPRGSTWHRVLAAAAAVAVMAGPAARTLLPRGACATADAFSALDSLVATAANDGADCNGGSAAPSFLEGVACDAARAATGGRVAARDTALLTALALAALTLLLPPARSRRPLPSPSSWVTVSLGVAAVGAAVAALPWVSDVDAPLFTVDGVVSVAQSVSAGIGGLLLRHVLRAHVGAIAAAAGLAHSLLLQAAATAADAAAAPSDAPTDRQRTAALTRWTAHVLMLAVAATLAASLGRRLWREAFDTAAGGGPARALVRCVRQSALVTAVASTFGVRVDHPLLLGLYWLLLGSGGGTGSGDGGGSGDRSQAQAAHTEAVPPAAAPATAASLLLHAIGSLVGWSVDDTAASAEPPRTDSTVSNRHEHGAGVRRRLRALGAACLCAVAAVALAPAVADTLLLVTAPLTGVRSAAHMLLDGGSGAPPWTWGVPAGATHLVPYVDGAPQCVQLPRAVKAAGNATATSVGEPLPLHVAIGVLSRALAVRPPGDAYAARATRALAGAAMLATSVVATAAGWVLHTAVALTAVVLAAVGVSVAAPAAVAPLEAISACAAVPQLSQQLALWPAVRAALLVAGGMLVAVGPPEEGAVALLARRLRRMLRIAPAGDADAVSDSAAHGTAVAALTAAATAAAALAGVGGLAVAAARGHIHVPTSPADVDALAWSPLAWTFGAAVALTLLLPRAQLDLPLRAAVALVHTTAGALLLLAGVLLLPSVGSRHAVAAAAVKLAGVTARDLVCSGLESTATDAAGEPSEYAADDVGGESCTVPGFDAAATDWWCAYGGAGGGADDAAGAGSAAAGIAAVLHAPSLAAAAALLVVAVVVAGSAAKLLSLRAQEHALAAGVQRGLARLHRRLLRLPDAPPAASPTSPSADRDAQAAAYRKRRGSLSAASVVARAADVGVGNGDDRLRYDDEPQQPSPPAGGQQQSRHRYQQQQQERAVLPPPPPPRQQQYGGQPQLLQSGWGGGGSAAPAPVLRLPHEFALAGAGGSGDGSRGGAPPALHRGSAGAWLPLSQQASPSSPFAPSPYAAQPPYSHRRPQQWTPQVPASGGISSSASRGGAYPLASPATSSTLRYHGGGGASGGSSREPSSASSARRRNHLSDVIAPQGDAAGWGGSPLPPPLPPARPASTFGSSIGGGGGAFASSTAAAGLVDSHTFASSLSLRDIAGDNSGNHSSAARGYHASGGGASQMPPRPPYVPLPAHGDGDVEMDGGSSSSSAAVQPQPRASLSGVKRTRDVTRPHSRGGRSGDGRDPSSYASSDSEPDDGDGDDEGDDHGEDYEQRRADAAAAAAFQLAMATARRAAAASAAAATAGGAAGSGSSSGGGGGLQRPLGQRLPPPPSLLGAAPLPGAPPMMPASPGAPAPLPAPARRFLHGAVGGGDGGGDDLALALGAGLGGVAGGGSSSSAKRRRFGMPSAGGGGAGDCGGGSLAFAADTDVVAPNPHAQPLPAEGSPGPLPQPLSVTGLRLT